MKFYQDGDLPAIPAMYFIYGDGGTGKTSLTKLFHGHKFVLSFDLSTNPLIGDKDVDVMLVERQDFPKIQDNVETIMNRVIKSNRYQVLVLDNMSALQNYVLENIDNASKDGRQNYQKLQLWFRSLGTLIKESNKTILATAHQVDNGANGLTGGGRYAADMNEKTFNAFTSMFDVVGRIYIKDGERLIDLDPEQGNHAKNRLDDRKLIHASELVDPKTKNNVTKLETQKEKKENGMANG